MNEDTSSKKRKTDNNDTQHDTKKRKLDLEGIEQYIEELFRIDNLKNATEKQLRKYAEIKGFTCRTSKSKALQDVLDYLQKKTKTPDLDHASTKTGFFLNFLKHFLSRL